MRLTSGGDALALMFGLAAVIAAVLAVRAPDRDAAAGMATGPAGTAQDAPGTVPATAGTRYGSRCYNGRYWADCGPAEQSAEQPEASPPVRQTRVWKIAHTDTIWVIDTTGVCLYWASGNGSLVAVPKTQLPKGSGCE